MVVQCELKIPLLWITVQHHSASLVMPNSYPRDGIFNPHITTIKESYKATGSSSDNMTASHFNFYNFCILVTPYGSGTYYREVPHIMISRVLTS